MGKKKKEEELVISDRSCLYILGTIEIWLKHFTFTGGIFLLSVLNYKVGITDIQTLLNKSRSLSFDYLRLKKNKIKNHNGVTIIFNITFAQVKTHHG